MLPAAFDYRAPTTLDEALGVLKERGDDAKILAGGMSLIPLLKLRFAQPALVLDIGRLPGLNRIAGQDGHLSIGALVRHVDVERSGDVTKQVPLMTEAVHWIADPLVRNRGTVVGSVCHADPAGSCGGAYNKLERKVGDFATVAVAVQVEMNGGKVSRVGIGLTSVGATNIKATEAEKALAGREPTDEVIREAARLAAEAAQPKDDIRGSAAYKKDVVRVFVQRGLHTALSRAQEARS